MRFIKNCPLAGKEDTPGTVPIDVRKSDKRDTALTSGGKTRKVKLF